MDVTLSEGHHAMGWLEWSATIVKAVVWPIAVVTIAAIFRAQIMTLIPRLAKVSVAGAEATFTDRLDAAEKLARSEQDAPPDATPSPAAAVVATESEAPKIEIDPGLAQPPSREERFQALLAISPEAAIIYAWEPIEALVDQLCEVAKINQFQAPGYESFAGRLSTLWAYSIIPSHMKSTLQDLESLRNSAAHSTKLSRADAFRFKQLADSASRSLEGYLRFQRDRQ